MCTTRVAAFPTINARHEPTMCASYRDKTQSEHVTSSSSRVLHFVKRLRDRRQTIHDTHTYNHTTIKSNKCLAINFHEGKLFDDPRAVASPSHRVILAFAMTNGGYSSRVIITCLLSKGAARTLYVDLLVGAFGSFDMWWNVAGR